MQLSVSIVSFNTKALLKRCLASIFKFTKGLSFEVIVVDNGSTDDSAAIVRKDFPQVKLIQNRTNRWYSGANNQALNAAKGKYFLILNSDIFLKDNAFKSLVCYLSRHQKVGAVEPLQQSENGKIISTGSRHNRLDWDLTELTLLHKLIKPPSQFRLVGKDRRKTWPAEVICDAALLLRTSQLKKIGGYDEKFKLYYTENDLCRRLQQRQYKAVHLGTAKVWHSVSASTKKAGWKIISPIYTADARQYYRKYHGRLQALAIWSGMSLSNALVRLKQNFWLIVILGLATWLRFYRLADLMSFIGDQGRDYLAARDMVLTGRWPLVGIASSVPWLKQGPFFIWITAAVFKCFGFNPVYPAILTAVAGVVTVYLVWRLSNSYLSALVLACSSLAVVHSRMPYHTALIPLFAVLYLTALKNKKIIWSYLLAGILLQFELSTLPLLLFTFIKFKKISWVWLLLFFPKIIFDFSHGFTQTAGFAAWSGYRLVNFLKWGNASAAIWQYWVKFIAWGYPAMAAIFGLAALTVLIKNRLLLGFIGINLLAFYLHGSPGEAYFPLLFPAWAMLIGSVKSKALQLGVIGLCLFNVYLLISHDFFPYGPPLSERLALTRQMLIRRIPFKLKNPLEIKFSSYLDNYRYLIWWLGGREDSRANLTYTFYE
jgi:GT2 family glycosyltransferase